MGNRVDGRFFNAKNSQDGIPTIVISPFGEQGVIKKATNEKLHRVFVKEVQGNDMGKSIIGMPRGSNIEIMRGSKEEEETSTRRSHFRQTKSAGNMTKKLTPVGIKMEEQSENKEESSSSSSYTSSTSSSSDQAPKLKQTRSTPNYPRDVSNNVSFYADGTYTGAPRNSPSLDDIKNNNYLSTSIEPKSNQGALNLSRVDASNEELKRGLKTFRSMSNRLTFNFNAEGAAKELAFCLQKYSNVEDILLLALSLGIDLKKGRKDRMWRVFMISMGNPLFNQDEARFIRSYLLKSQEIRSFSAFAVKEWFHAKKNPKDIIRTLSIFTRCDLEVESPGNWEKSISTTLHKEYGFWLLHDQLKDLYGEFTKELEKIRDPYEYALHPNAVLEKLVKDRKFHELKMDNQDKLCDNILETHAENLYKLIASLLDLIYAMKFSPDLSQLLQLRRAAIFEFLKEKNPQMSNDDLLARSRIYVSADLFLRILNPYFLDASGSLPFAHQIMDHLTKVIEHLCEGSEFKVEKKNLLYEMLNPLINKYLGRHIYFVELRSGP